MSVFRCNGWSFESCDSSRIMPSARMEEWQSTLAYTTLPEMIFEDNRIIIQHQDSGCIMKFVAFEALREAKKKPGEQEVVVRYASHWRSKDAEGKAEADQGIRWTFETDYEGDFEKNGQPWLPEEESTETIDYELLKDRTQSILFSETAVLYEDELHDNGVSKLTVRMRVMPSCFFLLMRHWLRVDEVVSRVRDIRVFHKFGSDLVVRETSVKELELEKTPSCGKNDVPFKKYDNPDEHQHLMKTISVRTQCFPLK
eukprot:NODE_6134_length_922_cov_42.226533_g5543_i0.p1 GENE.NODE_6134_length_922_cov_42.226533_g5543_i0~~NODE_6134_length_922_cov_42.226533_g5543_i0.p1  ORF type:complete len:256 (+),score=43.78 NODE_6134_length_922_cov_42.226533_g5543_i0:74-841(+)